MSRVSSGSKSAKRAIGNRVLLVMTVFLLLGTMVSGYCLYLAMQSDRKVERSAVSNPQIYTLAGKLAGLVKTLHQLEDQFIGSQDIQSMQQFNTILSQLATFGKQLESTAAGTNDAKTAGIASSLLKTASDYETSMSKRIQAWESRGQDEAAGLQAKLHVAAEKITSITPVSEPKKMADVLDEIKRGEKEYFSAPNTDTQTQLEIASNTLQEIIRRSDVPEPEKGLLHKGIKNYIDAFNKYQAVSLATEDPALKAAFAGTQQKQKEAMQKTVQELENIISNLPVSPLEAKLTLIRQYEKEYLLQPTEQNVTLMNQAIAESIDEVESSSLPEEQKVDLKQALTDYRGVYEQMTDLDKVIHETVSQSAQYLGQLDSQVKQLPSRPPPPPNKVDELIAFLTRADILPAAAAIIAVLLIGLIAAFSLARSVSTQTAGHNEAMFEASESPEPSSPEMTDDKEESRQMPQGYDDILAMLGQTVGQLIELSDTLPGTIQNITDQNQAFRDYLDSGSQHSEYDDSPDTRPGQEERLTALTAFANEMAEEMNMLALNAAIKAEKAGTHGREFILVAEELEKLSQRFSESTRDLADIAAAESSAPDRSPQPDDASDIGLSKISELNAANALALDKMAVDANIIIDQVREIQQAMAELGGRSQKDVFQEEGEPESDDDTLKS